MAQVTVTKVVEGQSHLVIRVNLVSDGVGELINEVIISPSDLIPAIPNTQTAFRIMQVWYGLSQFDAILGFNTTLPLDVWTIAKGTDSHVDFRSFGGLMDYASNPPGVTDGKLWLSTAGFNTVGFRGSLVLELRKTNSATTSP